MPEDSFSRKQLFLQEDVRQWIRDREYSQEWLTVYLTSPSPLNPPTKGAFTIYSWLFPKKMSASCLETYTWNRQLGNGYPGTITCGMGKPKYYQFSDDSGSHPLVFHRTDPKTRDSFPELLQEFVFFHDLYFDHERGAYFNLDDDGEEDIYVTISEREVKIKIKRVLQFLKMKKMDLALYTVSERFSSTSFEELDIDPFKEIAERGEHFHCGVYFGSGWPDEATFFSRLISSAVIQGPIQKKEEVWPQSIKHDYEKFIIDVDRTGECVYHSCDPEALSSHRGSKESAAHPLTPVLFRKDVLKRYYSDPSKYEVYDGSISFKHYCTLHVDLDMEDKVMVYIKDLNLLTHKEQLHWKSFNIPPSGPRMSKLNFKRTIEGQWADPERADILFLQGLEALNTGWSNKFGWPLILPLHSDDAHLRTSFHIPVDETWSEFESQIIGAAKLAVDSLNERKLSELLDPKSLPDDARGLVKLELFLAAQKVGNAKDIVGAFRRIQSLRSVAAAHRKGENFDEKWKSMGFGGKSKVSVFNSLIEGLNHAVSILQQSLALESAN